MPSCKGFLSFFLFSPYTCALSSPYPISDDTEDDDDTSVASVAFVALARYAVAVLNKV